MEELKRGVIADYLPWIIIALAVLAIVTIAIFLLKGEGFGFIDKVKNLLGGL
jgi:hypothetical protein